MSGAARRFGPLVAALVLSALLWAAVNAAIGKRTDMAAFLPQGRSAASRFLLQEVQSGGSSSIILLGLEGAPPAELARISTAMAQRLAASGLFSLAQNGQLGPDSPEGRFLFDHRYLLSPSADFGTAALRADLQRLLAALQSSASPLAVRLFLPDPTGAFPALGASLAGSAGPRLVDGTWFAPGRDRALLVAQTKAAGFDIDAQVQADAAIRAAFAASTPGTARLIASGPAEFAREAAASIKADVMLITLVSSALVLGLLLWRFRSLAVLAAIAVPMLLSMAAATVVTRLVFGFVHGIAFGFGMTMLGITLDYPVLLVGHRKRGEAAPDTLHRIGRAFLLAVLCAALGLSGMAFTGFPGLAQLGVFAATGVLAAAAVTALLLPRLIVAANLAPTATGNPARLLRIEHWRRYRRWGLLPVAAALAVVVVHGVPWQGDIASLSPVPQAALAENAELQRELGAPDLGQVLLVSGPSQEAVLAAQEALLPRLAALASQHAITGYQAAASLLPSAATQRARQAALPDRATLAARLSEAQAGLPFAPGAFAPFQDAVEAARTAAPLTLADVTAPALAARLHAALFTRQGLWFGPISVSGVSDPAALRALPGATLVDIHAETNALVARGAARAGWCLAGGAVLAALLLLAGLRQPWMVLRIALAIAAAMLTTVAILAVLGVRLSLVHLAALQLTAGVGLDYALFYARRQLDAEERARTLRTLVTCNAMTLLTFGLLAFCRTPLLVAIGTTVAIGAVSAMCFSFLFVGLRPPPDAA